MNNCLIIAGEKSGEEHALSFFNYLKDENVNFNFFGVGGDELQANGLELIYHLRDFSTWGISEAIGKVPFYYKALKNIELEVEKRNCKVAILIDFQTFNLKLAIRLKAKGVKVLYYVAPQAWAWKEWRVKALQASVDTLFCILPFEKKWFMQRGVNKALSIEHPVFTQHKDEINTFSRNLKDIENESVNILLLPGSRKFEVSSMLPECIKVIRELKKVRSVNVSIVKSSSVDESLYAPFNRDFDHIYRNEDLNVAIKNSDVALAASGTVNLSCALFSLPTIVAYTGSLLNKFIFETFVSYKGFISIANIVHEKPIFPELIGDELSAYNIKQQLNKIISCNKHYHEMITELNQTKKLVSGDDVNIKKYISEKLNESYIN